MTIRQRGKEGICSSEFWVEGEFYQFTFNGKKRLVERGVHHYVISALLGHATSFSGFGYASRITPGYAHATWDAMVAAIESLEQPVPQRQQMFGARYGKIMAKESEGRWARLGLMPNFEGNCNRHVRTRTADPYRVKVVLYQLSYVPVGLKIQTVPFSGRLR